MRGLPVYHCVLNTHFHGRHPDPYAFIKFLQQQDAELERRIRQLETGAPARKRKATYVAVDAAQIVCDKLTLLAAYPVLAS